ncbi:Calcium-dependent protein kinase 12 [Datura stramonium]|uniref:Calcium-dependent protein kinase 12 n=1 Tax=Datura stramonium TaxID=4076 RepID=A0ABS8SBD2_DATST|nr:Calcium-dependent protein kinase 12 [Datura stramonium]
MDSSAPQINSESKAATEPKKSSLSTPPKHFWKNPLPIFAACKTIPKEKLICKEDYEDLWSFVLVGSFLIGLLKRQYSEKEAAKLIKTIVGVVEACHSLGVMHRDLKPENFLFLSSQEDAALKATDFGLSVSTSQVKHFLMLLEVLTMLPQRFYASIMDLNQMCGVQELSCTYYLVEFHPFGQILRGKLDFESEPWPGISDSAKDLIRKILDRNPKRRLTAHEVLCHPWIVDDSMTPDKPLDSAVLSRLKQFSAMNKLKKMALRVIAERLSEEEIGGLKELFKMLDTDNSGTITFEELKEGLRRVGSELMESEIKDLMDAADIDNSGTIDYGEFIAATVHLNKLEREENLLSAFSFFDKDGSGYITIEELQQACKEFGLSELNLDEIIKDIDQDNDGQIDYGEFSAMMRKGTGGGVGRRTIRNTLNLGEALGLVQSEENA